MRTIFNIFYDSLREDMGYPGSLCGLIKSKPELRVILEEPEKSICAINSIVPWHEWGYSHQVNHWPHRARGELMGWHYYAGSYCSFIAHRDEFNNFGSCHVTEWSCDIQTIQGLSSSKSTLSDFSSLDELVETNSREMIDATTEEKLKQNLAHAEIRILRPNNTEDFLTRHLWDGRICLMNNGGSHHFAAARYISSRLDVPVLIHGKLYTYSINPEALYNLQRDFEMFVILDTAEASKDFLAAMNKFRATYLWQRLPRPYKDKKAILLPRKEPRSAKVAQVLRKAGFLDLGEYLSKLVLRQKEI